MHCVLFLSLVMCGFASRIHGDDKKLESPGPSIPQLKIYTPLIGVWDSEVKISDQQTFKTLSSNEWDLGGRYVLSRYKSSAGEGLIMTTWDQQARVYRRWQFASDGFNASNAYRHALADLPPASKWYAKS